LFLNFNFKFTVLSIEDVNKLNPVEVDVDSVVYGFSSLSTYKPTMPFDVNLTGSCVLCRNTKFLQGLFGVSRKSKYERLNEFRCGLLFCFYFIANSHVKVTLGDNPPIRVLVSISSSRSTDPYSDSSETSWTLKSRFPKTEKSYSRLFWPSSSEVGLRQS